MSFSATSARPARSARRKGWNGGRGVIGIEASPPRSTRRRAQRATQPLPWHQPVPKPVYRFNDSMSSWPREIASSSSCRVTSSQRHTRTLATAEAYSVLTVLPSTPPLGRRAEASLHHGEPFHGWGAWRRNPRSLPSAIAKAIAFAIAFALASTEHVTSVFGPPPSDAKPHVLSAEACAVAETWAYREATSPAPDRLGAPGRSSSTRAAVFFGPSRLELGGGGVQSPSYSQRASHVSKIVTRTSDGRVCFIRSQIHFARISLVGFSRPSISFR